MSLETVARRTDEAVERDPPFIPGPIGTHITIRGLTKHFAGQPLYENFDLDFPKGRIVSIFGPNGCGKSTLINMIAGLIPIDSGQILFDGKSLRDTTINSAPNAAIAILLTSETPKISRNKGMSADDGVERKKSIRNSTLR